MSWFKKNLKPGRWDGDRSIPGRPSHQIKTTEQVRPEANIVYYQEKPRMQGRLSAGRTRMDAARAMEARGNPGVPPRGDDEKLRLGTGRAGPSPLTHYTLGAPTTARDRHNGE